MRIIAAALVAGVAIAAPAEAADLSFIFSTTASGPSIYISGSGKLTIDEATGANGRYDVTGVAGNFIAGILQEDNSVRSRSNGPLTVAGAGSFITFASDGSVLNYDLNFGNDTGRFELGLIHVGGNPYVGMTSLGVHQAAIAIEGFVPPVTPPPVPQPGAVPEPASWAMMIGGFGLVGGAMRRRRRATVTYA